MTASIAGPDPELLSRRPAPMQERRNHIAEQIVLRVALPVKPGQLYFRRIFRLGALLERTGLRIRNSISLGVLQSLFRQLISIMTMLRSGA